MTLWMTLRASLGAIAAFVVAGTCITGVIAQTNPTPL
jgi:hypothetical protein